jgi:hypothetical protein
MAERYNTSQSDRVDVFSVITDRHVGLTEADGVFTRRDIVELLQLSLVDKLLQATSE